MGLREILGLAMILYFVIFAIVDGRHTRSAGKPVPRRGDPPGRTAAGLSFRIRFR